MSTTRGTSNNSPEKRMERIESRLTNLGRWLGFDLTVRANINAEVNSVCIKDGSVYADSNSRIGDILLELYRYQKKHDITGEMPLVINGREIGLLHSAPTDDDSQL